MLTTLGLVRVPAETVWTLWCGAAPRLSGDRHQEAALLETLHTLNRDGTIELPAYARDKATGTIPRSITVPIARKNPKPRPWTTFPWRVELGWAASRPSMPDQLYADLVLINYWLNRHDTGPAPIVPMRYRSVDIFGREKRLDELVRTSIFAPDRLTLDMLACARLAPPLPAAATGNGQDVLVVENSDTYWAAAHALTTATGHPIGAVAWGCGRAFPSQASSLTVDLAGRGPVEGRVWYWGDYDPPGLAIAAAAAAVTDAPAIHPAEGLWAVMGTRRVQESGAIDWAGHGGRDWMSARLDDQLAHIRAARGRVAQEAVPAQAIVDWALSLMRIVPGSVTCNGLAQRSETSSMR
ncbi:Wadjet anti-phage system protein JetD domain-containing protein [Nocardia thraciensis]